MFPSTFALFLLIISQTFSLGVGFTRNHAVSEDTFRCLNARHPLDFTILHAWNSSIGVHDPNVIQNGRNAYAAGIDIIDITFLPCFQCKATIEQQLSTLINYMVPIEFRTIFLDATNPVDWSRNTTANWEALKTFVHTFSSMPKNAIIPFGVGTNAASFAGIFGSNKISDSNCELWWIHPDKNPHFTDFHSFGGFSSPSLKEFDSGISGCSTEYFLNSP